MDTPTDSDTNDVTEFTKLDTNTRKYEVFVKVIDLKGRIYTDQTGRFPYTSSLGKKYIVIAYDYDSNTINAESTKSRAGDELKNAYKKISTILRARGLHPKVHLLDNECVQSFKDYMT